MRGTHGGWLVHPTQGRAGGEIRSGAAAGTRGVLQPRPVEEVAAREAESQSGVRRLWKSAGVAGASRHADRDAPESFADHDEFAELMCELSQ